MRDERVKQFKENIKSFFSNRNVYVGLFVVILMSVLMIRLFSMQIIHGDEYNKKAGEAVISTADITAKARRGDIYDRNGVLLATTRKSYEVRMVNYDLPQEDRDRMYLNLIELFEQNGDTYVNNLKRYITPDFEWGTSLAGEDKEGARSSWINTLVSGHKKSDRDKIVTARDAFDYLRNTVLKISDEYTDEQAYKIMIIRYTTNTYGLSSLTPLALATDASSETMEYLTARSFEYPGITTEEVYFRTYEDVACASHVLGYVRAISEEEYQKNKDLGYSNDDLIGKLGIEKAAESYLRGENGVRTIFRDDSGSLKTLSYTAPVEGDDVYLTIDYKFQEKCVEFLEETINDIKNSADGKTNFGDACAGACVIMKVKTGEVLAMANYPYYDNSIFVAPSTDAEAQAQITALFADPSSPSLNRATQGLYPIGSTIKPLVSIAALMSGTITSKTTINCEKTITIGGRTHKCLSWHGSLNLTNAIARSCNIYFYEVGIRTGIDKIDKWAQIYGLGEKTGIEIEEYSGNRSNPQTMKLREKDNTHVWSDSDTAQSSIGQLYTLFTPVQLCTYTCALANGGYIPQTHLISSVISGDGTVVADDRVISAISRETGTDAWVMYAVKQGMLEMVKQSAKAKAAFSAFPEGFVAAKTGTPETGLEAFGQSSHSVLICYAPADNPEIAISIVIEHGAAGSNSLPCAARILEEYFNINKDSE